MSNRSTSSSKLFLGTVSQCFKVYILQTILSKHHHAISCFFFVQGGSRPKRTIFRVFWVLGCDGVELIFLKNTTPNLAAIGRQWPRGQSVPMRVNEAELGLGSMGVDSTPIDPHSGRSVINLHFKK